MRGILLILAILGFLAVGRRVALAALRLLRRGVDRVVADQVADVRARRGDITGLADADVEAGRARRAQLASVGVFSFWVLLLVAPALTPWPLLLFAAYSLLWLLPRRSPPPS